MGDLIRLMLDNFGPQPIAFKIFISVREFLINRSDVREADGHFLEVLIKSGFLREESHGLY
jgi:hypothetical protein